MGSILHDIRHAKDLKQQPIRDKIELAGQFSGYESGQAAGEIISEIVSFIGPTKLAKIAGKSKLISRLSQVPKIEKGLSYIKQARTMLSDNYLSTLARESYGATKDFFRSRLGNLWDDLSYKKFAFAGLDKFRYGDDIGKHTARLYQSTGESAEFQRIRQKLYGEASEQSGRKVGREFSKEASEQLAKHSDDVADAVKAVDKASDAARVVDKVKDSIPKINYSDLPANVQNSYKKYSDIKWEGNFKGQTEGTAAGKKFRNADNSLPNIDKHDSPITYKEFDVNNKLPSKGRDGERFVRGSDGSVYYTDDHYKTFKQIK